jgi:hypothetical protein
LAEDDALAMLRQAEITAAKLVPWGSNYTFAVGLAAPDDQEYLGIYKPRAGERPLWDFPGGTLYLREHASYLLSRWLGWDIVPPTVVRDGPHGEGSMQLYIEPGVGEDDQAFWSRRVPELERIVMFDHLANNADRKIGHCLVDTQGRIWGIDHGLTFNIEPKLRTVLWQFCGEPISPGINADLCRLINAPSAIHELLEGVLSRREVDALLRRARFLEAADCYPLLDPHYNVPHGWW